MDPERSAFSVERRAAEVRKLFPGSGRPVAGGIHPAGGGTASRDFTRSHSPRHRRRAGPGRLRYSLPSVSTVLTSRDRRVSEQARLPRGWAAQLREQAKSAKRSPRYSIDAVGPMEGRLGYLATPSNRTT